MRLGTTAEMLWARRMLQGGLQAGQGLPLDMYRMLEAYYLNNGLYDSAQQALYENGIWTAGMKPLRNPAKRAVEFHVTHIWPGPLERALPVVTHNPRILGPLRQVWDWSNRGVKKQLAARWFALYGDWFCKVASTRDSSGRTNRVFLQNIKPELVTDFETDERGNIISLRLDIPQAQGAGGVPGGYHTEVWTRSSVQVFRHGRDPRTPIKQLGSAVITRRTSDFGIDFVPFVHAPFMDMGEKRGLGVFTLALDKIDEANRMATRLHQVIFRFNKPTMAILANANDKEGRPVPAPKLEKLSGGEGYTEHDDDIKSFPGSSRMEFLVPNLNYQAHLDVIAAQMRELEEDLPELSYYRQREFGSSISGRAVRLLLSQAVDRTLEARGNIETALAKADKMALTIGINTGIFDKAIGSYRGGDLDHTFAEREVIPFSAQEAAETLSLERSAGVPLLTAVRRRGWTEADVAAMQAELDSLKLSAAAGTV